MTFLEFLKIKKEIDPSEKDMGELMAEHYDEYLQYLLTVKEDCSK